MALSCHNEISWVYPRAGGGTEFGVRQRTSDQGLSPRRRGNLHEVVPDADLPGSIPAQAGEPPSVRFS